MKNKNLLILTMFIFFIIIINSNLERKYLDKILLISNGTFENLSVTILLRGNNIYQNQLIGLIRSLPFEISYNITSHEENLNNVIIINFINLTNYDQYKFIKDLFLTYDGKYYDYMKISGTYKISIPEYATIKTKDSLKEYLEGKSFKVLEFINDNMYYIKNDWIMSNIEGFNIALCNYDDGIYLYIGLPEIMMNY